MFHFRLGIPLEQEQSHSSLYLQGLAYNLPALISVII